MEQAYSNTNILWFAAELPTLYLQGFSVFFSNTCVIPDKGLGESIASVFISITNKRLPEHVLLLTKVNYRDQVQSDLLSFIAGCMTKLN